VSPGEGILHQAEAVDLLPANVELFCLEVTLVKPLPPLVSAEEKPGV